MPLWLNILMQISALAGNAYNLASGVLPPKLAVPISLGIQCFVSVVGIIAHHYNTDGTSQAAPFIKMVILLMLLAASPAFAQKSYELGASFNPSTQPRFKGAASMVLPIDSGMTFSYTTAIFNKAADSESFSYSMVTGIRRKLPFEFKGIALFGDVQAGVTTSSTATSGAFMGGFAATRPLKGHWFAVLNGKAFLSPAGGGIIPQVQAGFGYQ